MIPPYKLAKLSRSQRLRKAAKVFGEAEHRFAAAGQLGTKEAEYLGEILDLLAADGEFLPAAAAALKSVRQSFTPPCTEGKEIRRSLNTVYHLLLAETGRYQADWDFIEAPGILDPSKRHPFPGMQVYLEDIRSPFNVGSMFRAAESFGAAKVWISPLCADPRHKRAERTAMGCVDILPWERLTGDPFADPGKAAGQQSDYSAISFLAGPFFALETGGTPLKDFTFPPQGILIAGSEELGVSPGALAAADASLGRVTIPTYGAKGSLNVSVAFGIVLQAWAAGLLSQTV